MSEKDFSQKPSESNKSSSKQINVRDQARLHNEYSNKMNNKNLKHMNLKRNWKKLWS